MAPFYLTDLRQQRTCYLSPSGNWLTDARGAQEFATKEQAEEMRDAIKKRRILTKANPGNLKIHMTRE